MVGSGDRDFQPRRRRKAIRDGGTSPQAGPREARRALVIDPSPSDRALALELLGRREGLVAVGVADAAELARELARGPIAAMVVELEVGWATVPALVEAAREVAPGCAVVLFTAGATVEELGRLLDGTVDAFVPKGSAGYLRLPGVVERCLGRRAGAAPPAVAPGPLRPARADALPALVDRLPVGVFACTAEGSLLQANEALARMLGAAAPAELIGRRLPEAFADAAARDLWRFLAERRSPARELEVRVTRPDGSRRWLSLTFWWEGSPGAGRYEGAVEDCTAAREAREELSRQAAALARSNEELEQYAHVVSHDLQEPLQLVTRYARLLAEGDGEESAAKRRRHLEHVVASAERMQAMIDDILVYSRSGAGGRPAGAVVLDEALDAALENLAAAVEEAGGEVRRDPLPTVTGDFSQMVQVFQNLIANALKFRGERPPRVRVGAEERDGEWAISVQDNGIGIAPADQERIFGMFERLHPASRYPGSGIGLAICKRIVERHRGALGVTSRPGEGTTFWMRLPKGEGALPERERIEVREGEP